MRRFLRVLAIALAFAAALFALLAGLVPRETLKTRIGQQIAAWTGREVSLSGEPEIDFFPHLTVTLNDVEVGGPEGMENAEIISMDRLTGTIRLFPLIIGRVEIGSFTMVRPQVRLVRAANGDRNWAFDSGAAALQLAFAGDVPLGEFLLEDGVVIYEDRGTGEVERLDSVNLSVSWMSVRQPLAIAGTGIWRGEQVTFSAAADAPFAFIDGGTSPVEARIDSAPIAMIFTGSAGEYPNTRLAGPLRMSTPSLRRFVSWLGSPIGPGSTLGAASLFGSATFQGMALSVEEAELALDGNSASGALKVTTTVIPELTGTLAFDALDLTPYFAGLSTAFRTAEDWRRVSFDTDWFRDLTADIRLSTHSVRMGDLRAGASAATLSLREARLEIGLARADIDSGSLTGDLAIADFPGLPHASVEAQLRMVNLDLDRVAPLLGLPEGAHGTVSAVIDVTARGENLGELLSGASGGASLDIEEGAAPLLGIGELANGDDLTASTVVDGLAPKPVTNLTAAFSLAAGSAMIERASIVAPTFTADAAGRIGLDDGSLALDGTIFPGGSAGAGGGEAQPFAIEGTIRRPVQVPLAFAN